MLLGDVCTPFCFCPVCGPSLAQYYFQNECYQFTSSLTHAQASSVCRETHGSELLMLESSRENQYISTWITSAVAGTWFWIGLSSARYSKPVTNDPPPLGPEKAVFSGRWSLVRGLRRTTIIIIMNVRPCVPGDVVCSVVQGWSLATVVFSYRWSLVAGGL